MDLRFHPTAAANAANAAHAADAAIGADSLPAPAANPASAPAATGSAADDAYRAKATEAAVKFESFFIGQMLHKMRESARSVGDRDKQEDAINSDMLDLADNLVADQLAQRHAFGIADSILRQLLPAPVPAAAAAPAAVAASAQNSGQATTITKKLAADT